MGTLIKKKIIYSGSPQYYEMPGPSEELVNTIVQYVGTSNSNYINGYFYKCIEVVPATDPKTYMWERCDVQPNGSIDAYTKTETDALLAEKAALDVSTISTAGGGTEVHANVSQGDDEVSVNYYKQGTELPDYVNLNVSGDGFRLPTAGYVDKLAVPFIANYGQTPYADVTAAIDADRAIVVNFTNNKNLICVTYATYAAGQNVTMSGIYKYGSDVSLAEITLTPENAWSIAHTAIQEKLASGTNIKTVNGESLLGSGDIPIYSGGDVFRFKSSDAGNDGFFDDLLNAVNDRKRIILDEAGGTPIFAECISATISSAPSLQKRRIELFFSTGYWKNSTITQGNLRNNILSLMLWENDTKFLTYYERNQEQLVSGTNIKTINNQSLLGSGNIDIPGGGTVDTAMSDTSENAVQNKVIKSYVDGKAGMNLEIGVEKWFGTYKEAGVTYQVYSKAIKIDALPAQAGITAYPHGISGIKQILQVYGFCTNGFVMNAPRQTASDNITIYQVSKSASNQTLSIEVGKDRSSVGAYVVLVYAKNN